MIAITILVVTLAFGTAIGAAVTAFFMGQRAHGVTEPQSTPEVSAAAPALLLSRTKPVWTPPVMAERMYLQLEEMNTEDMREEIDEDAATVLLSREQHAELAAVLHELGME